MKTGETYRTEKSSAVSMMIASNNVTSEASTDASLPVGAVGARMYSSSLEDSEPCRREANQSNENGYGPEIDGRTWKSGKSIAMHSA